MLYSDSDILVYAENVLHLLGNSIYTDSLTSQSSIKN